MNKCFYLLAISIAVIFIAWLIFGIIFGNAPSSVPENPLYKNTSISVDERVQNLLSYMTLEEKIGQMVLVEKNSIKIQSDISKYGIGAILSGFGGKPDNNTADGWKEMVSDFVVESKESRLGIPILYGVDAIHGHSNVPGFVVFPHFIALGASGDPLLVKKIAQATRDQMLATNVNWSYSPTYDLPQDIRWGRVYETFSDDPVLAGSLGSAYIEGLQENNNNLDNTISVLATPKHFIGAGSMLWDTSSNESFKIDQGVTKVDFEKLKKEYLPPFQEAINTGALSVMVGLNSWGDTKMAAESNLINEVLKKELAFSGFVVSDWYGVYEISDNNYQSAVTAINAGVDMVMLPFDYEEFIKNIKHAVRKDDISENRINDAVQRILKAKFSAGLFDEKTNYSKDDINFEEQKSLARRAVAQSAVLLKNSNSLLPISSDNKKLFISGSAADNIGQQVGAWTVEWQGVDGNWLPGATSILEGIKSVANPDTEIVYSSDAQFGLVKEKANIGIAVVGEKPYAEGWGDNPKPSLSSEDIATINRLKLVSEKILVVLVTGRPLIITEELKDWDGLVVVWLPGSEGAGVADVLFGERPFTGKLPLPWPSNIKQLPIMRDGSTSDGSEVLFERYFGLDY